MTTSIQLPRRAPLTSCERVACSKSADVGEKTRVTHHTIIADCRVCRLEYKAYYKPILALILHVVKCRGTCQ